MVRNIATQLFLLLAIGVAAGPVEEAARLQGFRSSILRDFGNLALTNEEVLDRLSGHVNRVLGVAPEHKNFWSDLIAKKTTYKPTTAPIEDFNAKIVHDTATELKDLAQNIRDMKGKGADLTAEAKKAYQELATKIDASCRTQFTSQLYADVAYALENLKEKVYLNIDRSYLQTVVDAFYDSFNELMQDDELGITIDEQFADSIAEALNENSKEMNGLSVQVGEVLSLIANGAREIRMEALYMFSYIQIFSLETATFVPEVRLSRLHLLMELLVLFGVKGDALDQVEKFTETLFRHRKDILRGKEVADAQFAPLYLGVVKNFLAILKQQVGAKTAYELIQRFLGMSQETKQSHFEHFLEGHLKTHGFPVLKERYDFQNDRDLIKTAAILTTLPFKDVSPEWFDSLFSLRALEKVLAVDPNTVNTLGYITIQFHPNITPLTPESAAFLDAFFEAILTFLELYGKQVYPEDYFAAFDSFLDLFATQQDSIAQFYFFMKLQNVYASPSSASFPVSFLALPDNKEAVLALKKQADHPTFRTISAMAWNTYVKLTGLNKKSKKEAAEHFFNFLGKKDFDSKVFPHADFRFDVVSEERNLRPSNKPVAVVIQQRDDVVIRQTPRPTPHKIEVDNGAQLKKDSPVEMAEDELVNPPEPKLIRTKEMEYHVPKGLLEEVEAELKNRKTHEDTQVIDIDEDANLPDPQLVRTQEPHYKVPAGLIDELSKTPKDVTELHRQEEQVFDGLTDLPEDLDKINPDNLVEPLLVRQNAHYQASPLRTPSRNDIPSVPQEDLTIPNEDLEKMAQEQAKEAMLRQEVADYVNKLFEDVISRMEVAPQPEDAEDVEAPKDKEEVQTEVHTISGQLSPMEETLLQQPNLEEILKELSEITDEFGTVTSFALVKIVPKESRCFETLFA